VPFDRIGDDLHRTLALLNEDLVPSLHAAVERANGTLASVGPDSAVNEELRRALGELADAARALELTADELERKPQSLIFGKGDKD
jgi:paraquat-inducible protein B